MRVFVTNLADGTTTIHLTAEIPLVMFTPFDFPPRSNPYPNTFMDKYTDFDIVAAKAARFNVGKNRLEMPNSFDQLRTFLVDLTHAAGLESVVDQTRYSLTIQVARGFEPCTIAIEVANCIRQHFYPGEPILMEAIGDEKSRIENPEE